ncbi:CLUMA_CG001467, isoform A [Clunio marinus]|uniref:CLUMA_CG001467, isoform A n=1 Tax=Clunio marinus TaxID=568069 RepID=A0A1J1HJD5_9DIPT|nr:CLUMA_CG001467, isoform A [Clunio marinus]
MKFSKKENSSDTRLALKLSSLVILLTLCYSMVSTLLPVVKVTIPDGCATACPPQNNPERFICARSRHTGRLGMFDSECFFGRYNHCVRVNERYDFVRYGVCHSTDF